MRACSRGLGLLLLLGLGSRPTLAETAALQPVEQPDLDTNCAQVVSVVPTNGAQEVECNQEVRIRFDRPMNPYGLKLEWLDGGFQLNGSIRVSADQNEFLLPVRLTPGEKQTLALNRDWQREMETRSGHRPPRKAAGPQHGFVDAHGVAANEARWSFTTQEAPAQAGAPEPRVVGVSPASGATTPVLTLVEIAFDQPMRPPDQVMPYLQKPEFAQGPSLIPSIEYEANSNRFIVPVLLRPEDDSRLTLCGFYSAKGIAAEPVVLHYQSGSESLDAKSAARAKAAAQDPKLQQFLAQMKHAREQLTSGVETVQTIRLSLSKGSYNGIEAQTATFKWQGAEQVYADITGPMSMCRAFILGCDGRNCWLYSDDGDGKKRLDQTPVAVTKRGIALVDPFRLAERSVDEALGGRSLVWASDAQLEGRPCYRLEDWDVSQQGPAYATKTQWWIDQKTLLPNQIVQYHPYGCEVVRFDYQQLNEHLPDSAFQPPAGAEKSAQPLFFKDQPASGEHRFLSISDGSNGRMSGRLGWHGDGGTTSSGLN